MRVALHKPSSVAVHTGRNHSPVFGLSPGSSHRWGFSRPGFGNAELSVSSQPGRRRRCAGINQGVKPGLSPWEEAIKQTCEIQSVGRRWVAGEISINVSSNQRGSAAAGNVLSLRAAPGRGGLILSSVNKQPSATVPSLEHTGSF